MGYEPIGRIRPVAPGPSLLTSARPLPGGTDWRSGVSWTPACQPSHNQAYCTGVDRLDPRERDTVHTVPFTIYTPMSCVMPVAETTDLEQLVSDLTETHTAFGLARALWMGEGLPSDDEDNEVPTLRRVAWDASGAGLDDLDDGISRLLAHYEECTGGLGGALIHMPSALVTYALGGGAGGARLCWPEGTLYRGPLGSVVVPGPGYPLGRTPHGPFGAGPQIAAGNYQGNEDGSAWVYITGPVEYAVSPVRVIPEEERDRIPYGTNHYDLWGERDAIVRFDPCCVFATEVTNPAPMPEVS